MRTKCQHSSLSQFTRHALRSYFQLALSRVQEHLRRCGRGSIGQLLGIERGQDYSKLSEEEITERGSFLGIVW